MGLPEEHSFRASGASLPALIEAAVAMFPGMTEHAIRAAGVEKGALAAVLDAGALTPRLAEAAGLARDAGPSAADPGLLAAVEGLAASLARMEDAARLRPCEGDAYHPTPALARVGAAALARSEAGETVRIGLGGPAGCGKSQAAYWLARQGDRPIVEVNCGILTEPDTIFGSTSLDRATSTFIRSEFAEAVQTPGAVVLLDEANRMPAIVGNGLFPLLTEQGRTIVPGTTEAVTVAPGVIFVMTMNRGAQYTGTDAMDAALLSRIAAHLDLGYLDADAEVQLVRERCRIADADAGEIVAAAAALRRLAEKDQMFPEEPASTRAVLAAAGWVEAGLDLDDAIATAMTSAYSAASFAGRPSPREAAETAATAARKYFRENGGN